MLWIEKYRPVTVSEIRGQDHVVTRLAGCVSRRSVPHMLFSGPHGTGKSAAAECFAHALFGDSWQENTTVLDASDLFSRGKQYLHDDERYAHIYRHDASLITNVKAVLKYFSSLKPLIGDFRLLVIESADHLSREAQHALRRTMEKYSKTSRFILITTRPSALIPALTSRCLPLPFSPFSEPDIISCLSDVLRSETRDPTASCGGDSCELIAHAARGDLRRALLLLETTAKRMEGEYNLAESDRSETGDIAHAAFAGMRRGDVASASRALESLVNEYGLSGQEVLRELRGVIRREYNDPRLALILADTDHLIGHCNNEYIQLNALAARIAQGVFHE